MQEIFNIIKISQGIQTDIIEFFKSIVWFSWTCSKDALDFQK